MEKKRPAGISASREAAYEILNDIFKKNAYSNLTMRYCADMEKITPRDRALVTEIVYGTVRNRTYIDSIIGKFVKNAKKVSEDMTTILRMSFYQLARCKNIPEHAVCNEAVLLAKHHINQGAGGFANAVLRNALRARETWDDIPQDRYDIKYSCPQDIIDIIKEALERLSFDNDSEISAADIKKTVLCAMLEPSKVFIRINRLRVSEDSFTERMRELGIDFIKSRVFSGVLELNNGADIKRMTEADSLRGCFTVQDPGAAVPVYALDPQPGEHIIDCCAAPGGKTVLAAALMQNRGRIDAYDIHQFRAELVEKICSEQGVNIVKTCQCDASVSACEGAPADRILADVPCSGLGVIRRKPEIKWSFDRKEANDLARLQLQILNAQSERLKPGGTIVYSTCTLNKAENEDVIESFLASHSEFELVPADIDIDGLLTEEFAKTGVKQKMSGMITLIPGIYDTDGFFVAKMKRRA